MNIKWDSNIDYQVEAVNSVINIFMGLNSMNNHFTLPGYISLDQGIGNLMDMPKEYILENLKFVQEYNKLNYTNNFDELSFDIQIDRRKGKIYVYLRTIFELNKHYGFTKFIIVVLNKSQLNFVYNIIEDTKEHFEELYDSINYNSFCYDSSDLELVRNFAVSDNIQIMIMTLDSFNSKNNIINNENDKFGGNKPIDFISKTNPVVIFDKSQSNISNIAEKSIETLNPLFTLNYFSKSNNFHNLIYKYPNPKNVKKMQDGAYFEKQNVTQSVEPILKQMNSVLDEIRKGKTRKEASEITGIPLTKIVNWIIEGRNRYDKDKTYFYNELIKIEQNKNNKKLYCVNCRKTFANETYKFCPLCSMELLDVTRLLENEFYLYCSNCGKEFNNDFKFCPYCGKTLKKESKFKIDFEKGIVKAKWNNKYVSEYLIKIYEERNIMADPPLVGFFEVFRAKDKWDLKFKEDSKNLSKKHTKLTFNQVKSLEQFINLYVYMGYEFNEKCRFMDDNLIINTFSKECAEFYINGMNLDELLEVFRKNEIILDFIQIKSGKNQLFYVLDKSIKNKYRD